MSTDLRGYTVFMTGGSSGLGFEMSKALLRHGATVVVGARPGAKLDRALEELKKCGDAHAVALDVRDEQSVRSAADWYMQKFDRLDMLINNAGIGNNISGIADLPKGHSFCDIPLQAFKDIVETNFIGYFSVVSAFMPMMIERGRGSLVFVSTSDRTMVNKGQIPYGPSKAGAEAMTEIIRKELEGTDIAVNIICPGGFTRTGIATDAMIESRLRKNQPILEPDVLNSTILFLASEKSKGITGEKIVGKEFDQWLKERGIEFAD